eukprot:1278170-Rhodomonas_salina.5
MPGNAGQTCAARDVDIVCTASDTARDLASGTEAPDIDIPCAGSAILSGTTGPPPWDPVPQVSLGDSVAGA